MNGQTETLKGNVIAENSTAQVDEGGQRHLLIDEIKDHRVFDEAVPKSEGTFETRSGLKRKRRTTAGWEILVRWKDGSLDWVKSKDLKDSCPVQVADCAVSNKIQDEPAFAW